MHHRLSGGQRSDRHRASAPAGRAGAALHESRGDQDLDGGREHRCDAGGHADHRPGDQRCDPAEAIRRRPEYQLADGEPERAFARSVPGLYKLIYDKWRIDELYDATVVGMVDALADIFTMSDKWIVDGIVKPR